MGTWNYCKRALLVTKILFAARRSPHHKSSSAKKRMKEKEASGGAVKAHKKPSKGGSGGGGVKPQPKRDGPPSNDDAPDAKNIKRKKKKKPKNKGGSENHKTQKKAPPAPAEADDDAEAPAAPTKERRDFASDLKNYLSQWAHKEEYGGWRFNKNLQVWALEHVFDDSKIDADLFKLLLPYLASIQGAAKDRLLERADKAVEDATGDDDGGGGGSDKVSDVALKRALKIRTKVGKKS
jgi:WKF domain